MKRGRACGLALACLAIGAAMFAQPAQAEYPERPIRLVVPTGAGGITDILARILGERLGARLGQPIVIENKPGGAGVIGSQSVASAKPDGYTLLMAFPSHVANPSTLKSLPYDTATDFAPIAKIGQVAEIVLVNKDSDMRDMQALAGKARQSPDAIAYGSVGAGSLGDVCTRVFQTQAGVEMLPVAFKSEPDMLLALLRNDIQVAFTSPPAAIPMIKSGKVRALAISSAERFPSLPDIPTIAQSGFPGYDVTGWNAIFAPKGTPPQIIARLNQAINAVLAEPAVAGKFVELGVPPLGGSPETLQASVVRDIGMIKKLLDDSGYVPQ
ncbi:tripartite tricarboxylate transporter substrate binding protein [Orrella sp. JC864]|uniref:Bug family tripartite tricarboxylate transporter substrate binding protein n=1 Tax=Orrella sp. JC864 TaxID=3120298 RepID=UPI0012BD2FB7